MTLQTPESMCDQNAPTMMDMISMNDLSDKTKDELLRMVGSLQKENYELKKHSGIKEFKKMSDDNIERCIREFVEGLDDDAEVYPSDISNRYDINPDDVERVMDRMKEEGYFE